jgi:hypothetical protein
MMDISALRIIWFRQVLYNPILETVISVERIARQVKRRTLSVRGLRQLGHPDYAPVMAPRCSSGSGWPFLGLQDFCEIGDGAQHAEISLRQQTYLAIRT